MGDFLDNRPIPLKRKARPRHTDRARPTGRYKASPPCDGCGKPVGTDYATDDEVCGGTDGPGFFLCNRKLCGAQLEGMTVEQRRAHYTAVRAKSEARR